MVAAPLDMIKEKGDGLGGEGNFHDQILYYLAYLKRCLFLENNLLSNAFLQFMSTYQPWIFQK